MRGLDADILVEHFLPNAFTRHSHEQWQFMVIAAPSAGWMKWKSPDGTPHREPITGSQVWIVPPGQFHTVEWSRATDVIKLYVDAERAPFAPVMVHDACVLPLADFVAIRPMIMDLCQDLRRHAEQPNGLTDWDVACTGSKLAADLMAAHSAQTYQKILPEKGLVEQALEKLRAHVADGNGRPPLKQIARELKVSPRYLSESFRKLVGSSIREWVRVRRVQTARDLLMLGNEIKDVLHATGFGEQSDLNRALKKEFGLTAAAIRAAGRKRTFHKS